MTDLNLLSFSLATPQSSDKSAMNSNGGDGEAGFAALLAAQWPADVPAEGGKVDEAAAGRATNAGWAEIRIMFSSFQGIAENTSDSSEKASTNFSSSKFTNALVFEANDKLKFVELGAAGFSLFQGVAEDISGPSENVRQTVSLPPGSQSNALEAPDKPTACRAAQATFFIISGRLPSDPNDSQTKPGLEPTDASTLSGYAALPVADALPASNAANQFVSGVGPNSKLFSNAYEVTRASSKSNASPKIAEGAQPESILMQSIGRTWANKESADTHALRTALPPPQAAMNNTPITSTAFDSEKSVEGDNIPALAQFTSHQPDALHEGFISRQVKSLVGRILNLGWAANDSMDARASKPAVAQSAEFTDSHIEQSLSPGEPASEEVLVKTEVATNVAGAVPSYTRNEKPSQADAPSPQPDKLEVSAKLLAWNPMAASVVMIPPAARLVSPVPEAASSSIARGEEAMRTTQTPQSLFAEFYKLPVTTPRNYESTPGARTARTQSLFKAIDQQPTAEPPVELAIASQLGALLAATQSNEAKPVTSPASNGSDLRSMPPENGTTNASSESENIRQDASLPGSRLDVNWSQGQAGSLPDKLPQRFSLFRDVGANDIDAPFTKLPAIASLNSEAKGGTVDSGWPESVVSNLIAAQSAITKPDSDQPLIPQTPGPATTGDEYSEPDLAQLRLQSVEPQPGEIQIFPDFAAPIAIVHAPIAEEVQSQAFQPEGKDVNASAAARPDLTTSELSLNPRWLKAEATPPQDKQISSFDTNVGSHPGLTEDTHQQAEISVDNGRITPTEAINAPAKFAPSLSIDQTPPLAENQIKVRPIQVDASFRQQTPKPAARDIEAAADVEQAESSPDSEKDVFVQPTVIPHTRQVDTLPDLLRTETVPVGRATNAQGFVSVAGQQSVNQPLVQTDFAGAVENNFLVPDSQQKLPNDATTSELATVLPALTARQTKVSPIATSRHDDQPVPELAASLPVNVQQPVATRHYIEREQPALPPVLFSDRAVQYRPSLTVDSLPGTQIRNPLSAASGIQIEYIQLPLQESEAAPVVASLLVENKEPALQAGALASDETTLPGARGPLVERDDLRLRNLTVAQSAATSAVESKESVTSSVPLAASEQVQVARVAPHRASIILSPGVPMETANESSVGPVQPEESFGPSQKAYRTSENVEFSFNPTESGQTEVRSTFLAAKPAKLGPRGDANMDKATTDLPTTAANPAADNAAVSQKADAKVEEPNAAVRQLTPPLIEASESLTPGKQHTLRLNLQPVDLGQVEIQITRDAKGHLNAHMTVEREAAGQTLSEGIPQLREALERAGLQIDRLVVSTGTGWNGEGQAKQADAQQFTRTSGTDFFEADPANIGGDEAAEDRLLNLHA